MFTKDKKFIYDLYMADFFIEKGAKMLFKGVHKKTKKQFVVFRYNQKMKQIYDQWNLLCKNLI